MDIARRNAAAADAMQRDALGDEILGCPTARPKVLKVVPRGQIVVLGAIIVGLGPGSVPEIADASNVTLPALGRSRLEPVVGERPGALYPVKLVCGEAGLDLAVVVVTVAAMAVPATAVQVSGYSLLASVGVPAMDVVAIKRVGPHRWVTTTGRVIADVVEALGAKGISMIVIVLALPCVGAASVDLACQLCRCAAVVVVWEQRHAVDCHAHGTRGWHSWDIRECVGDDVAGSVGRWRQGNLVDCEELCRGPHTTAIVPTCPKPHTEVLSLDKLFFSG